MKGEDEVATGPRAAVVYGLTQDAINMWRDASGCAIVRSFNDDVDGVAVPLVERGELVDALVELKLSSAGLLVVHSVARLGGALAWAVVSAVAERIGAKVVVAQGKSLSARAKLTIEMSDITTLLFSFVRLERAVEIRAGQLRASRSGRRISRHPPYGYSLGGPDGVLVEVPAESAAVARMWALKAEGASLKRIAERLTEEGFKTRRGGPWQRSTIRQVLKRPRAEPT